MPWLARRALTRAARFVEEFGGLALVDAERHELPHGFRVSARGIPARTGSGICVSVASRVRIERGMLIRWQPRAARCSLA